MISIHSERHLEGLIRSTSVHFRTSHWKHTNWVYDNSLINFPFISSKTNRHDNKALRCTDMMITCVCSCASLCMHYVLCFFLLLPLFYLQTCAQNPFLIRFTNICQRVSSTRAWVWSTNFNSLNAHECKNTFTNKQNIIACYYSLRCWIALKAFPWKAFTIIKYFAKCLKTNYLKFSYRVPNILSSSCSLTHHWKLVYGNVQYRGWKSTGGKASSFHLKSRFHVFAKRKSFSTLPLVFFI